MEKESKELLIEYQNRLKESIEITNNRIEILGEYSQSLSQYISDLSKIFDKIRDLPTNQRIEIEYQKKLHNNWKNQVEKIEKEVQTQYKKLINKGIVGTGLGVAVVTLGPSTAMGIATTFGVASTGTAIATLSGAAATNAALAWLGGGAIALGGGGIAAGQFLLTLAGPVGWTIAGLTIFGTGILALKTNKDKEKNENIISLILLKDIKRYNLAVIEIDERIKQIIEEKEVLFQALKEVLTYGTEYSKMTEKQQYNLGTYVNLMNSSIALLTHSILALQPDITDDNYYDFVFQKENTEELLKSKNLILNIANILFGIDLDNNERRLFWQILNSNPELLKNKNAAEEEISFDLVNIAQEYIEFNKK